QANNVTVRNSTINNPRYVNNPSYCGKEGFQMSVVDHLDVINTYLYLTNINAIYVDSLFMNGVTSVEQNGATCSSWPFPIGIGPTVRRMVPADMNGIPCRNGQGTGSYHTNVINSDNAIAGQYSGYGSGTNDPTTNGGVSDLNFTGN